MKQAVCIIVFNDQGQILTVTNRRFGGFSCPGGKVDEGESLRQAASRELYEETGLVVTRLSQLKSIPVDDPRGDSWMCTGFEAIVTGEVKQMEKGTVPSWRSIEDLCSTSMYADWYKQLFLGCYQTLLDRFAELEGHLHDVLQAHKEECLKCAMTLRDLFETTEHK